MHIAKIEKELAELRSIKYMNKKKEDKRIARIVVILKQLADSCREQGNKRNL